MMINAKFKTAMGRMMLFIALMISLPAVLSFTAEYPRPVTDHYLDKNSIYWKIRQITVSPIFDEPETSLVEFYFEKSGRLYLQTPDQEIFAIGDTIWTYLKKHNQIQRTLGGAVFNPFDFIDTSQAYYKILESGKDYLILKSEDQAMEPDSLRIEYDPQGTITSIVYLDTNENEVILEFLEESFIRKIPADNFLFKKPKGVEVIDISD